jgi:hypothetical protein
MGRNFVGDRKSRQVINAVLNIPGMTWTAAQQEVIKSLLEFPGRPLFIHTNEENHITCIFQGRVKL